ncbi:thaumatin-like protein [Amborella trichopoda]|uniref:thaumatin-like protein n=1 Tax=Amborella trichopoda TaxID=13333 RepID=UPI0005D2E173|nr:thaumatin-like protein [Amborella trichopoda]|eukprot:XP_011621713.1 thaumatin-like protein [Amborella trichopoda]
MSTNILLYPFSLLLLQWFSGASGVGACTIQVTNKCSFPIWPATASNAGHPVIAEGGFYLPPSRAKKIEAPANWSGRLWGRTNCDFGPNPACETGDCSGKLACNGTIGTPPATLVEFSLQPDSSKPSFHDVSLVDGYNLPISVSPRGARCSPTPGCAKDLKSHCPPELRVTDHRGSVVACKSACLAFNLDVFCCRNDYGSPDKCHPSMYSTMFKDACPAYFSYAYDMPPPLYSCVASEYVVTFCPSKWGLDSHQPM